jgi:hypothetical protein
MRFKTAVAVISLSLVCLVPRSGFADTLTLTGSAGQLSDNEYVFPYYFTVTGANGTNTQVDMSCMNLDRGVPFETPWNVYEIDVAAIGSSAVIDGEPALDFYADALLYNQYAGAAGNAQQTSDLQYALWSIMDPTVTEASTNGAFDANAQELAAAALSAAATAPDSDFVNNYVFVPSGTYAPGTEPQMFMTNPLPSAIPPFAPSITPEPASLLLLGTGFLGGFALLRLKREREKALCNA